MILLGIGLAMLLAALVYLGTLSPGAPQTCEFPDFHSLESPQLACSPRGMDELFFPESQVLAENDSVILDNSHSYFFCSNIHIYFDHGRPQGESYLVASKYGFYDSTLIAIKKVVSPLNKQLSSDQFLSEGVNAFWCTDYTLDTTRTQSFNIEKDYILLFEKSGEDSPNFSYSVQPLYWVW